MKQAAIETEKIMVGETPCRKILAFQNILAEEELPGTYIRGVSFYRVSEGSKGGQNGNMWNGEEHVSRDVLKGTPLVITDLPEKHGIPAMGTDPYLYIDDVLREDTFQAILVWLKRCGSRLAKIRKKEHESWSGMEVVTI
jgi:hypothetical protein